MITASAASMTSRSADDHRLGGLDDLTQRR
jgi:hypothetical protein